MINFKKTKTKSKIKEKKIVKRVRKKKIPVPIYIRDIEVMFPDFKRIVNKGDSVPEMSLNEARARRDFIIKNESED